MIDFLTSLMWLTISSKLKMDIEASKKLITDIEDRFNNDKHFNLFDLDKIIVDTFVFYLDSKKYLGL